MDTIIHIHQVINYDFFKNALLVWFVLVSEFYHYNYVKCLKNCMSDNLRSMLIVLVQFIKSTHQLSSVDLILLINLCLVISRTIIFCEFLIKCIDDSCKCLVHLSHLNYFIFVSVHEWTIKSVCCLLVTIMKSFKIFIQSLHLTILTAN